MNKGLFSVMFAFTSINLVAQVYTDTNNNMAAKRVQFADIQQFAIGSYGEVHYNHTFNEGLVNQGNLDLHRLITYLGYRFTDRLQFFSEIEFEHTNELAVEQAFFNYRFNDVFNLKAGVLLVPMGYVNEFHEPTLFNGVERPNVDRFILPSTWRETGFGLQGLLKKASLKYQAYLVNGFLSYNGNALISGKNGLRSARQGGDNGLIRTPSFTGKLSYFGVKNLLIEASAYIGSSNSTLYNGVSKSDIASMQKADSSVMNIAMWGMNLDYTIKNFKLRFQGVLGTLSNVQAYNAFTNADAPSALYGYYSEISYTFDLKKDKYLKLTPFVRYENYDTHYKVNSDLTKNLSFHKQEIIGGLGLWLAPGLIIKSDVQFVGNGANDVTNNIFNLGFGYWF